MVTIGVRKGNENGYLTLNQNFLGNLKSAAQFRLIAFFSNEGLLPGMTLTLHKSQVYFSGIMQR